ncbi:hypothetical protein ACF0H5_009938 [Mactra antiquata]
MRFIVLALLVAGASAQTTLRAVYDMSGVSGKVTFFQNNPGDDVTITLGLEGMPNAQYTLQLHEFRVNYDTAVKCSTENIGAVMPDFSIGSASVTSGQGTLVANGMDLSGTKSIEGRSFLITDSASLTICATIEADADYITAFAHLPAHIGGSVVFRQQDNTPNADTFIYLDLYFLGDVKPATLSWQINEGVVKMDIDATTDITDRCGSTIKGLYNPDGSTGDACTTDDHSDCKIGNLTAKHGAITMQTSGKTKAFYGDLKLPLSNERSIIGKTLVFMNGDSPFACANIIEYPYVNAVAKFSNQGVTGQFMFYQKSPLDPVKINANLNNLQARAGGYHVHLYPVPQRVTESDTVCDATSVAGHYNPFNVIVDSGYPAPATTTPDKYEVGDLSGKFGTLATKNNFNENLTDPYLQLFGKNSIVGRSIVIHKDETGGPRWICSTIRQAGNVEMKTAYVRFTFPVIGYMVFKQPKDMWYMDTQIYVELDYGSSSSSATINHNWHVHQVPVGNDMLGTSQRCQSVQGHYNPYSVLLQGDYSTMCNSKNMFRCEVGDLSGKHGKINIRTSNNGKQKYFFTDVQLPLSGPQSIVGRSVTIHDANSGGGRLSCADIKLKLPREVKVTSWSSADGQSSPSGMIGFKQDSIDILSGVTQLSVSLTGLKSEVAGYHIHVYPTDADTPQADVCQGVDVGGHLKPFNGPFPGPSGGTQDQFEVGDLSGKFGSLSGASYVTNVVDMTLPMEGPHSLVGRSVVIHKNDDKATRWACGNILDTTAGSSVVEHRATFDGDITGYIHMSQYMYDNGDVSNTAIVVNLRYKNNSITTGHNWHVHERPVTSDCASTGPHYNPFMVTMGSTYDNECGMSNPLRCEMGDQAKKCGQYDIGSGKKFYTDVNLNLEGKYSAAKRSFVIHESNGGGPRVACANILPFGTSAEHYDLTFLTDQYTRLQVETKVAASLSTNVDNIVVDDKEHTVDCTTVTVYFLGLNKAELRSQFIDVLNSGNYDLLGRFAPHPDCSTSSAGTAVISWFMLLLCLLVTKMHQRYQ